MTNLLEHTYFAPLGTPRTVWSIPAIHGDLGALTRLHDSLFERITPGDRIVYHGNYTGYGEQSAACVDEILTFRRMVLAMPSMVCSDFIYLRGQQEQMWMKLLQLQFAPDPTGVLLWMLGNGLSNTLYSYGLSPHDGIEACRGGTMALTKWINSVRAAVRKHAGHETFSTQQQRAAYTAQDGDYPMLFVHAGLDSNKRLEEQGDHLWWASDKFDCVQQAYKPFEKVIRGYDPQHRGLHLNCITASVDDGCGFGGELVCVGFSSADGAPEIVHA